MTPKEELEKLAKERKELNIKIISTIVIGVIIIVLLFALSKGLISNGTVEEIWENSSADAKLIFTGLILGGMLAR